MEDLGGNFCELGANGYLNPSRPDSYAFVAIRKPCSKEKITEGCRDSLSLTRRSSASTTITKFNPYICVKEGNQ
ncbi:hypothetical protein F0562_007968 [Nyssa sinensis]|uniref:Uncharacterized protein n=1 Tax=Nyssa sinensis TaxID=561372 RepID=A0A5J5A7U6_9ASTE|nr:hypothetical protein F0562_007968 [Nyssa sinensis]